MRKVASESIVLLKNDNNILPLQPDKIKKVAIVGGNAKVATQLLWPLLSAYTFNRRSSCLAEAPLL